MRNDFRNTAFKGEIRLSLKTVLITGGAGFIGTHLVNSIKSQAERIVLVDNLLPQIHQGSVGFSSELKSKATCIQGDIRDIAVLKLIAKEYKDIEAVIHLAAMTGTGQSMYAIQEYDSVNCGGTATLLEAILDRRDPHSSFAALKKVILASSRAIYGEGAYRCECSPQNIQYPAQRTADKMSRGEFGFSCPLCSQDMSPVHTPEDAPPQPTSFYGVTKLVQEQYLRTMLGAVGIESAILRFQNVFGPGQSLKNPYTGVIGVFYSNIAGLRPINIYEDGEISRDFVYVSDVADALVAVTTRNVTGTYNIGSGEFTLMTDVAKRLCELLGNEVPMSCSGTFRVGDIRQNAADITRAKKAFGYAPKVTVQEGLRRYVEWAKNEEPMDASVISEASDALKAAGLSGSSKN